VEDRFFVPFGQRREGFYDTRGEACGWIPIPAAGLKAWIRTFIPEEDFNGYIPGLLYPNR